MWRTSGEASIIIIIWRSSTGTGHTDDEAFIVMMVKASETALAVLIYFSNTPQL